MQSTMVAQPHIPNVAPLGAASDFDFLVGRWRVKHQKLTDRLVNSTDWRDFGGTFILQKTLGGQANIDDNLIEQYNGTYRAVTIRVFDPKKRAWSIYWIDSRFPPKTIASPIVGGFEGHRGLFFADERLEDGRALRVRFIWIFEQPDRARYEQALSLDAGQTWEPNWRMQLDRAA